MKGDSNVKKKSNKKDIEAKILIAKLVMLKFRIHYRNESDDITA